MKNFWNASLLFLLILPFSVPAQEYGNRFYRSGLPTGNPSPVTTEIAAAAWPTRTDEIQLQFTGLYNAKPDSWTATFVVRQTAKTQEEAEQMLSARIKGFTDAMKAAGVDAQSIYVDFISFVPVFQNEREKKIFSKTYNEIPAGFEIQENVLLTLNRQELIAKAVSEAAKFEIYDLAKIDVYVKNQEKILDSLRQAAIQQYKHRIQEMEQIGTDIKEYLPYSLDDIAVTFPVRRYSTYMAYCNPSLTKSREEIPNMTNAVKLVEAPKPVSYIYDPLPADQFQFVMNPIITGPVVQYTYDLKILMKRKPAAQVAPPAEKKYFLFNQQGELKEIKLP